MLTYSFLFSFLFPDHAALIWSTANKATAKCLSAVLQAHDDVAAVKLPRQNFCHAVENGVAGLVTFGVVDYLKFV